MNQSLITLLVTAVIFFVSAKVARFEVLDLIFVVTSFTSGFAIVLGFMAFYKTEKNQKLINENIQELREVKISNENLNENIQKLSEVKISYENLNENIQKLSEVKISYENLVTHEKIEWLLNDAQLLIVEQRKKSCKEIWIVSPDPTDDTGDSPWTKVIQKNIKDGINYYYISPKSPSLDGAIKGLKTVFRNNLDKCMVVKLTLKEYEQLPHEHLVIYDPHNDHGESDSFAEIDTEEKGWWVKMPVKRKNKIVGKLLPLIKGSKTKTLGGRGIQGNQV